MANNPYNTLLDLLNAGANGTEALEKVQQEGGKLLERVADGVLKARCASEALRSIHDVVKPEGVAPHIQAVLPPVTAFLAAVKEHLKE